jgi:uncharacterized protein YdhG (YjbR/CyaY superfamily)
VAGATPYAAIRLVAKTDAKSVSDYIFSQPPAARGVLEQVRRAIRRALPGAEETISYRMPTYKLNGHAVISFAGWTRHYALYGSTRRLEAALKNELAPYEVNDKGTIRFYFAEPVPSKVIEAIAKFRAKDVAQK